MSLNVAPSLSSHNISNVSPIQIPDHKVLKVQQINLME